MGVRKAATAAVVLVTIGATFVFLRVEALFDRIAEFELLQSTYDDPVVIESTGNAGRMQVAKVGPLSDEFSYRLLTRETGIMVPARGGADGHAAVRHQWPGVYFEARFEGDSVVIAFDDPHNRYRITLDGSTGPAIVVNRPGRSGLHLSGLGPGPHDIRADRISESLSSDGTFIGFFVDAQEAALPPPPAQDRRIEFIGDSDSVGFGNLSGRRNCTGEEVFLSTDTQEAFGPRVARFFDADYRLNAVSGIGLVRNIQGADPERTMRSLYGRALFDSTVSAPPSNWSPQVIVVALGSNDFFSDLAATERWSDLAELRNDFVMQYVEFFLELRHQHPRAYLLSLAWDGYGPDYLMAHEAAISDLRDRGETSLDLMILPEMAKTGCLWHPDLADHEKVSNAIIRFLEARPEIWVN